METLLEYGQGNGIKHMTRCFRFISALAMFLALFGGMAFAQSSAAEKYIFDEMLKLASEGQPEAEYHVGMFYNNGIGITADPKEAFQWFKKSAEAGDPLGAYKLGCYYHGQFPGAVEPDEALGLKYKLIAAEAGYDLAQSDVAKRYYVSNDFAQAVRWWTAAARQGDAESMYHASSAYADGKGVPADRVVSFRYLYTLGNLPEYRSDQFVADAMASLVKRMSPEELAAANSAAAFPVEPTPLTLKAREGLSQAKTYLAANMR